jgi:hypothetical protein
MRKNRHRLPAAAASRRYGRAGLLVAILMLPSAAGCQHKPSTGEVSGKVLVAGAPVQFGSIAFIGPEGRVATAAIKNGTYRAIGVPTGVSQVTVQAVRLGSPVGHPTLGPLPPSEVAGKFVAVPDRYALPKTSGLNYEVAAGLQTKDFDLEAN